jgi:hypothetical protein
MERVTRRMREESGAQIVELALAFPLLLLLAAASAPFLLRMSDQIVLNRAVAVGARYAAKVDAKPSTPDPGCPGSLGRRRSAANVETTVIEAAAGGGLTLDPVDVDVSVSPCEAAIGDAITVEASVDRDYGAIAEAANAAMQLTGAGPLFDSTTFTLTAEATSYLE